MSVAIVTKFHGPTNYRGARITASVPSRLDDLNRRRYSTDWPLDPANELDRRGYWQLTVSYPYELSGEACHRLAAEQLAARLGWLEGDSRLGHLYSGALDDGYAFVFGPMPAESED